ncbi:hypothetical protein HYD27_21225 [Paenibacillus sp. S150]|nr:hypothetical protein [Paenibacillus sp. S150]
MEGFMRSQEAASRLSDVAEHSRSNRSAEDVNPSDVRGEKKGFMGKVQKIMKALDVSGFELITYVGEKAVGSMINKKKEAAEKKKQKKQEPGILSKTMDSLGAVDLGGIFDNVKSLGVKAITANASDEDKGNWQMLQNNMNGAVEAMGQKAIVALRPVLDALNNFFKSEQMLTMLTLVANAFLVIATVVGVLVDGLFYMINAIQQNWDVAGPILAAIAFVLLAAMIAQVYALAAAWLVANWPILLIVAAVGLLIYCLQQSGVSVATMVEYVAGAFGWLKAFIQNIVISWYNTFIAFADFFRNLFNDPKYAISKLFYDLTMNFLNFIYQMAFGVENFAGGFVQSMVDAVNMVLRKVKGLADKLSTLPGLSFLAEFNPTYLDAENPHVFSDMITKAKDRIVEPTTAKKNYNTEKKEYTDYAEAVASGRDMGKEIMTKFSGKVDFTPTPNQPAAAAATAALPANINRVNEVGTINGTVDISSDDLKMLRELAEIQAIQNFVELTPTVQVTTGNINNAGDIDSIITKIGQKLNEEFVSTAQGVYT